MEIDKQVVLSNLFRCEFTLVIKIASSNVPSCSCKKRKFPLARPGRDEQEAAADTHEAPSFSFIHDIKFSSMDGRRTRDGF